jgi:uncharacterized membrane protein YczE
MGGLKRGVLLLVGLCGYGLSMGVMVRAGLGLDPWDVLHQGLTRHTPMTIGMASAAVGVVVLLAWIPLRNRPGIGTLANVVVIAVSVDATLAVLPAPSAMPLRIAMMVGAVVLNAISTVLYIGAGLGPGPRDGLMTGLVARTGRSVRLVRTAIEATVLVVGWLLGGTVGVGTVVYAVGIGPLVQLFLRLMPRSLLFHDFGDGRDRAHQERITTMSEWPVTEDRTRAMAPATTQSTTSTAKTS